MHQGLQNYYNFRVFQNLNYPPTLHVLSQICIFQVRNSCRINFHCNQTLWYFIINARGSAEGNLRNSLFILRPARGGAESSRLPSGVLKTIYNNYQPKKQNRLVRVLETASLMYKFWVKNMVSDLSLLLFFFSFKMDVSKVLRIIQ